MTTRDQVDVTVGVETFRSPDGCLAYLAADDGSRTAWAIDPRLDQVDDLLGSVSARGLRLVHVLDTHTHADHLSGAARLARKTGAELLAHTASKLEHAARRIRGGDTLVLGATTVTVLDAPGHTPDSLALLIDGHLFTGDALLAGAAGRTDFPGGSASDLFDTFRRFEALPDATMLHPGHDYAGRGATTIGAEKADNPIFRERDREAFIARMSVKAAPPAGMAAIVRHNLGAAGTATIAPADLERLRARTPAPFILDVRSALEFESEHIDGAHHIPVDELEGRLAELPAHAELFVVCRSGVRATIAAASLEPAGRQARVLEGGMLAWRRARLPVRRGRRRLAVDRQVQLVAGTMVLAGVGLGAFVSPWFLGLAAFFGAGLTFAGATGTCGLARLLMKMPWNRRPPVLAEAPPSVCAVGGGATTSACQAPTTPPR